jgi:GAF domain-containing protein
MHSALQIAARQGQFGGDAIERVLGFARQHLGMDLAWISHIVDGRQVIEALDGAADSFGVAVGSSTRYQLDGIAAGLPGVVADLYRDTRLMDVAIAGELAVRAYLNAPLRRPDGSLYGMLSCFSHDPDPVLHERDWQFLQLVAEFLAPYIVERERRNERRAAIAGRSQSEWSPRHRPARQRHRVGPR